MLHFQVNSQVSKAFYEPEALADFPLNHLEDRLASVCPEIIFALENIGKKRKKLLEDRTILLARALNLLTKTNLTRILQGAKAMRKAYSTQLRLDCNPIGSIRLNCDCRDEIVPILAALQYVYTQPALRRAITRLIANDVNSDSRSDVGREGFSYWEITVLAAVRMGCDLDYDKLQDLAENHRALRSVMGIGDWDQSTNFSWRRIHDNLCRIQASTIEQINQLIVSHGQELHGDDARSAVRADSFVIETNVHFPTESSLIWDGMRKIMPLAVELAEYIDAPGWRQARHILKGIKQRARVISQISSSKSPTAKKALPTAYEKLLDRAAMVITRAKKLMETKGLGVKRWLKLEALQGWITLTEKVCDTARRRVLLGESVPNTEKLFSLFETHTQLYRRGKAGKPNQFGRMILLFEDNAGFISHYCLMGRDDQDKDVIVEQTRRVQRLHQNEITEASFDRGFYSPENEQALTKIITAPCLPPRHPKQYAEKLENASIEFRRARQRHSGVESAIGALQSGNGLKRCRDRSELGLERYLGLAIISRNLQTLGKLLIAHQNEKCEAARSKRRAA
jgi:hypothetical protein